jgi:hypothetical protein
MRLMRRERRSEPVDLCNFLNKYPHFHFQGNEVYFCINVSTIVLLHVEVSYYICMCG